MPQFIQYLIEFDKHIVDLVQQYGAWVYGILGGILFGETGLLVLPFLPGDTLLFACGVTAAQRDAAGEPLLSLPLLLTLLPAAAILGDTTNYWIGRGMRRVALRRGRVPFMSPALLERSNKFFDRWGPWAVSLGRWVPVVRTVVPFTAGLSSMTYRRFLTFSALGNVVWVLVFTMLGYWLGKFQVVKDNIGLVFVGLIVVVLVSIVFKIVAHFFISHRKPAEPAPSTPLPAPSGMSTPGAALGSSSSPPPPTA